MIYSFMCNVWYSCISTFSPTFDHAAWPNEASCHRIPQWKHVWSACSASDRARMNGGRPAAAAKFRFFCSPLLVNQQWYFSIVGFKCKKHGKNVTW